MGKSFTANPEHLKPIGKQPRKPDSGEFARLEAARRGDQNAFSRLVEPYRRELHVLVIEGDRLAAVTSFIDPSLPLRFGFPSQIQAEESGT